MVSVFISAVVANELGISFLYLTQDPPCWSYSPTQSSYATIESPHAVIKRDQLKMMAICCFLETSDPDATRKRLPSRVTE
jgi:hypothetical protein